MELTRVFSNSKEVSTWLESFSNLERGQDIRGFRLDRTEELAKRAGNPERSMRCIHVAGSKGKGSVSTMIAGILNALGYKAGLYTSPHMDSFTERIALAKGPIPEDTLIEEAGILKKIVDELPGGILAGNAPPSYFELVTILAFLCYKALGIEWLALETGLGGRLDSTNIVSSEASVITPIELEHTEYLGETVALIAGEKAGIIKPGKACFSSEQSGDALEVIRERADILSCPFYYRPECAEIIESRIGLDGTYTKIALGGTKFPSERFNLKLSMIGEIQAKNAALALMVARSLFPQANSGLIQRGIESASLPARFELIPGDPPIILEGAHTPVSVSHALKSFTELFGESCTLVFSCVLGKDIEGMAKVLAGHFSKTIIAKAGEYKKNDPGLVYTVFSRYFSGCVRIDQYSEALALAKKNGKPILIIGSFYLTSVFRKLL